MHATTFRQHFPSLTMPIQLLFLQHYEKHSKTTKAFEFSKERWFMDSWCEFVEVCFVWKRYGPATIPPDQWGGRNHRSNLHQCQVLSFHRSAQTSCRTNSIWSPIYVMPLINSQLFETNITASRTANAFSDAQAFVTLIWNSMCSLRSEPSIAVDEKWTERNGNTTESKDC